MKKSSLVLGGVAGAVAVAATLRKRRARAAGDEPAHQASMTALAGDALRTGRSGIAAAPEPEIPNENLQIGDPDVDVLQNEYVGDEAPGGDMPTPDQDRVDDIGRAYGVSEADSGELRSSAEILERRDRRR